MKSRNILAAVVAAAGTASAALAGFTAVQPAPGSELGHAAILNHVYGGTFLLQESVVPSYTNGALTFTRTGDTGLGGVLPLVSADSSESDDEIWSTGGAVGPATVIARAKYAGDSHQFGWIDDTAAEPGFVALGSTSSFRAPIEVSLSSLFRWALHDTTTGKLWTSVAADNVSGGNAYDQMVTYRVTGASITQPTFLLFWEDRIGGGADYDYNDAVIEVTAVPAPGVAAFGSMLLAGLARRNRR